MSIPVEEMYKLVGFVREQLGEFAYVGGYGHIGDGNLHLNIAVPHNAEPKILDMVHNELEPLIYEKVSEYKGSISAEHGVGYLKAEHLHFSKSPGAISNMVGLKRMLDPNNILNPYKMFETERQYSVKDE